MMLFNAINGSGEAEARAAGLIPGVVVGIVTNNQDPDGTGRVKVRFPSLSDVDESAWARIAAPMAGNARGIYFLPEVDDEVLIAFAGGDPRFPYVLGAMWNGKDAPPQANADGKNNIRAIVSRSGHVIKLNDEDGKETVEIIDKSTKNSIVIDTSNKTITVTSSQDIVLSAADGTITLNAKNVAIKSSASTQVEAGSTLELKSSSAMTVKGETVNIN